MTIDAMYTATVGQTPDGRPIKDKVLRLRRPGSATEFVALRGCDCSTYEGSAPFRSYKAARTWLRTAATNGGGDG